MIVLEIYIEKKYSIMIKSYETFSIISEKFYQKKFWYVLNETNKISLHRKMATQSEVFFFLHFHE